MRVYLRTKFHVSSIILTGFRQGVVLPPPTQRGPLKSPPRLRLKPNVIYRSIVIAINKFGHINHSNYIRLTDSYFKKKFYKHKSSFKYINKRNSIELSNSKWYQKNKKTDISNGVS